jgi:hypothetical protein
MQDSKLVFSATELQMASDAGWILTKNGIIDKVYILFGALSECLRESFSVVNDDFPQVLNVSPKISRGEKYHGLPWVMLDFPRYFKDDPGHFAIRTFFWWGNYFLIQAQFSNQFIPKIVKGIEKNIVPTDIKGYQLYAGYPLNMWNNTLPQAGLELLESRNFSSEIPEKGVLKIAIKLPIDDWASVNNVSKTLAEKIVMALQKH